MTEDLLEIAVHLARRDVGRPRGVSLRRAVSSAYYALFHALAWLCAKNLVGETKSWALCAPIYRSLDHRKALEVLKPGRLANIQHPALNGISVTFKALQEPRHEADYSPNSFDLNRSGTLDLIDAAKQAVSALDRMPKYDQLAPAIRLIARSR